MVFHINTVCTNSAFIHLAKGNSLDLEPDYKMYASVCQGCNPRCIQIFDVGCGLVLRYYGCSKTNVI
jgi:hypothetical protein